MIFPEFATASSGHSDPLPRDMGIHISSIGFRCAGAPCDLRHSRRARLRTDECIIIVRAGFAERTRGTKSLNHCNRRCTPIRQARGEANQRDFQSGIMPASSEFVIFTADFRRRATAFIGGCFGVEQGCAPEGARGACGVYRKMCRRMPSATTALRVWLKWMNYQANNFHD